MSQVRYPVFLLMMTLFAALQAQELEMEVREGSGFLSISVTPSGAVLTFDHEERGRGS